MPLGFCVHKDTEQSELFKDCNYLFHIKESLVLRKNNGNLPVQLKCF